jgi:amino acid adenylation domain-containing protein
MKAGGNYVPVDYTLPSARVNYILQDSGIEQVLSVPAVTDALKLDVKNLKLINIHYLELSEFSPQNPTKVTRPQDLSFIIYTSGSTGNPKGVMQTHKTLYNLIYWELNESGKKAQPVQMQYSSFGFDASIQDILFTLGAGGTLHIVNDQLRTDFIGLRKFIVDRGIEVVSLPFAAISALFSTMEPGDFEGHTIQQMSSTGEQLLVGSNLQQFLNENPHVRLFNYYGPSETHVVTAHSINHHDGTIVHRPSIGKPICNTRIYILDKQMQPVPVGVKGEAYLGGDNVARGYRNLDELTDERFIEDPFVAGELVYVSGDICRWLPDGTIEYLGRKDDQVKIRGYRIELGEVENVLLANEEIKEAVVLARHDKDGNTYMAAYLTGPTKLQEGDLRKYLKTLLPEYMVPGWFVQLDALPQTSNGKVDKRKLPDPEGLGIESGTHYVAPETETQLQLVEIWETILSRTKIGIQDNFFELGGHSLKVVQLISRMHKRFDVKLDLALIFEQPTIEEIAARLEEHMWAKNAEASAENEEFEHLTI